ncbi:hypothetical protein PYW08_011805 [Mythimna loreyi]|uniref:Uncharacterized protein n=1 Tax=Mythimna loreyi TaxID=667449 RepID=A0ACC2QN24_9NEOP|nr:hypothetical protein PYW08_011805 [Mythimna loreyi]
MFRTKIKKREAEIIKILNSLADCTPEQKEQKITSIQDLYALELFDNKQYAQCIKEFTKLKKDPAEVIKLFPELSGDDKEKTKKIAGKDLQCAMVALIPYLKDVKAKILNKTGQDEGTTQTQQLELIDTTLLKCYLLINAEVSPLLRNSNHCLVEEAETVLLHHKKHRDLMILYQTKGLHLKALQLLSLLKEQGKEQDTNLDIYQETMKYLKRLGAEHINLIFKFSDWILKEHPEKGLKIFTEENVEAEKLPRREIYNFLKDEHESLVIPYLEHVIHNWNDSTSLFHNALIEIYREKITDKKGQLSDIEVQHIRLKLLRFLEKSTHYTPETVAVHFPTDSLFEERAIIYGKLEHHEQALAILVLILGDVDKALRYCDIVGARPNDEGPDVYVILMKILINPEQSSARIGKALANVPRHPDTAVPDLDKALIILDKYANYISPLKALAVLPDSVPLDRLKHFLESAMDGQLMMKRRMQVAKGLWYAEQVQTEELEHFYQSKSIVINDGDVCPVCKKRFGNQSAFVRYPNVWVYMCGRTRPVTRGDATTSSAPPNGCVYSRHSAARLCGPMDKASAS